jgi:nucleoside-diphosphate-sugar epimerase
VNHQENRQHWASATARNRFFHATIDVCLFRYTLTQNKHPKSLFMNKQEVALVDKPDNKSILITGGTGFAGRYAIKRIVNQGHHVYALVRSSQRLEEALGSQFVNHNSLCVIEKASPEKASVEELRTLMEQRQISSVVHIGAVAREYSGTPWSRYLETNVEWTKNLALAFLQADVPHNKFVFTSTVGVYGTIPQQTPADEETPYNPDGKYHKSKMLAEHELLALKDSGLPLVIIRPSIMYGTGDFGFLYKVFRLSKMKLYPLSSSNPQFHLLDVELLAEVYAKLVEPQPQRFGVLNVCDREPVAAKTLLNYIKNSVQANYLTVPSSVFSFLKGLSRLNAQRSISFKLIDESWSYNVKRLEQTLGYESQNTLGSLESKYLPWYRGAA